MFNRPFLSFSYSASMSSYSAFFSAVFKSGRILKSSFCHSQSLREIYARQFDWMTTAPSRSFTVFKNLAREPLKRMRVWRAVRIWAGVVKLHSRAYPWKFRKHENLLYISKQNSKNIKIDHKNCYLENFCQI